MPRIWSETIDGHRRQVTDAVLNAAAELSAENGPLSVTMSAIAQRAGIGRATLYKYFPDVESILLAWHRRMFGGQVDRLRELATDPEVSLNALLAFALGQRHHLRGHAVALSIGAAVSPTGAMPDAAMADVVAAVAPVVRAVVKRGEARADIDVSTLAAWVVQQIHVSALVSDEDLEALLRSALAAPSPARTRHRSS